MNQDHTIKLPYPGRRARRTATIALASGLIVLTILGSIGNLLPGIVQAFAPQASPSTEIQSTSCPPTSPNATTTSKRCSPANGIASNTPNFVGADSVPNLSLPKTVVTSLSSFISDGGVLQESSQNLTIYNLGVHMRLLGGANPHDELLGPGDRPLSSLSSWSVQVDLAGKLIPLIPRSNNFTLLGTNSSGTDVLRTMHVATGSYSGTFEILYEA